MNDHDTVERLRAAMAAQTRDRHLAPDAAVRARRAAERNPHRTPVAIAATLVAVLVIAAAAWWLRPDGGHSPAAGEPTCTLDHGPLPEWARAGFAPDAIDTPHVLGDRGEIVAIPFVTLRVHQPPDTGNKVLWVASDGSFGGLTVRATLGRRSVTRDLPLGPSYLDLPAAGCWRLDLRWAGHHDRLDLRVAP